MFTNRKLMGLGAAALCVALVFGAVSVVAQTGEETAKQPGKAVTLQGKVVDLHCYITGDMPSADAAKCTADCIKAGVPAGLETADGLIILGHGTKGPGKAVVAHAFQQVTVKGQLFEKSGVKYLDIETVEPQAGGQPGNPE